MPTNLLNRYRSFLRRSATSSGQLCKSCSRGKGGCLVSVTIGRRKGLESLLSRGPSVLILGSQVLITFALNWNTLNRTRAAFWEALQHPKGLHSSQSFTAEMCFLASCGPICVSIGTQIVKE